MAEPIQPPQYHEEAAFAPIVADIVLQRSFDKLEQLWPVMTGISNDSSVFSRVLACYLITSHQSYRDDAAPRIIHEEALERFLAKDIRARARYVEFGASVTGRSLCLQLQPLDQRDILGVRSYIPHDTDLIFLRDGVNGPLVDGMPASLASSTERAVDEVSKTRLQRADAVMNLVCQAFFVK